MGEKIKDIVTLQLHDMEVAIELNDGDASSRDYKTIHIQNDRFRLQLKEAEYFQMAAAIHVAAERMRSEKDFSIKGFDFSNASFQETGKYVFDVSEGSRSILAALEEKGIAYAALDLSPQKSRFLISHDSRKKLKEAASEKRWEREKNPSHEKVLYGIDRFLRYRVNDSSCTFCSQIACRSTLNGAWVPLDRIVNENALERCRKTEDGIFMLSAEDSVCYLTAKCIYTDKTFSESDRARIEYDLGAADLELLQKKLSMVFFRFSGNLLQMLYDRNYDHIKEELFKYADY